MPKRNGKKAAAAPTALLVTTHPPCPPDCRGCGPQCPQKVTRRGAMAQQMFVEATEKLMRGLGIWTSEERDMNETAGAAVRAARLLLRTLEGEGMVGYNIRDFEKALGIEGEKGEKEPEGIGMEKGGGEVAKIQTSEVGTQTEVADTDAATYTKPDDNGVNQQQAPTQATESFFSFFTSVNVGISEKPEPDGAEEVEIGGVKNPRMWAEETNTATEPSTQAATGTNKERSGTADLRAIVGMRVEQQGLRERMRRQHLNRHQQERGRRKRRNGLIDQRRLLELSETEGGTDASTGTELNKGSARIRSNTAESIGGIYACNTTQVQAGDDVVMD
ncbi:hypothetical protein BGX38DRAFT_1146596 [Terfezia claveryi]|nr:hypothetical protein BGX38DRAFT_1146596 [Terfezia claveryi]